MLMFTGEHILQAPTEDAVLGDVEEVNGEIDTRSNREDILKESGDDDVEVEDEDSDPDMSSSESEQEEEGTHFNQSPDPQ